MDEQSVKNGTMGEQKKERGKKNVWNHNVVRRIFVAICSRGLIYTSEGFVRGGESNPCRSLLSRPFVTKGKNIWGKKKEEEGKENGGGGGGKEF